MIKELQEEIETLKLEKRYLINQLKTIKRQRRATAEQLREENRNLKLKLKMAEGRRKKEK